MAQPPSSSVAVGSGGVQAVPLHTLGGTHCALETQFTRQSDLSHLNGAQFFFSPLRPTTVWLPSHVLASTQILAMSSQTLPAAQSNVLRQLVRQRGPSQA